MAANDVTSTFPPFPENVPTHPLLIVDYEKLINHDKCEEDKFWEACTTLGFFYLKNHDVDTEAMWHIGRMTMALPLEEKMKYERGGSGISFGYKAAGTDNTDEYGNLDNVEYLNVARDDAINRPKIVHREYPPVVEEQMPTIKKFIESSDNINRTLMDIMSDRLGLPKEILREKHDPAKVTGSQSRLTRNPPKPMSKEQVTLGAHTDFGSLSFLHNILGGLQVLAPGTQSWQYVKPLPGHAICNIGDSLTIYSGGILRSNMHRVVPPPGEQSKHERWSLVYFLRPADEATMEPLVQSPLVAQAVKKKPINIGEGITAGEWQARRLRGRRAANRTGPETWRTSQGTEHTPSAA